MNPDSGSNPRRPQRLVTVIVVAALMLSAGLAPVLADDPQGDTAEPSDATLQQMKSHTSAVWRDDEQVAYIFGGTAGGSASSMIERFDPSDPPSSEDFSTLPDAVTKTTTGSDLQGRTETSAVWDDSRGLALIFGGKTGLTNDDPSLIDDVVVWDPDEDSFTVRTSAVDAEQGEDGLPYGLAGTSAVWTGETAYIFGGVNATTSAPGIGDVSTNILEFTPDPDADTNAATQAGASLDTGLAYTSAVWDDDQEVAYVFGGIEGDGTPHESVYLFDPSGPSIEKVGTLTSARGYTSAVWHDGAGYVFGGSLDDPPTDLTKATDRFGPFQGSGSFHNLTGVRYGTSAVTDGDGRAYVFGGNDGSNHLDEIIDYSLSPLLHQPDLTHAGDHPSDAVSITGDRSIISPTFTVRNDHPPCTETSEAGCATPDGLTMSLYVRSRGELEDADNGIEDARLSQLSAEALEAEVVNGTWPDVNATIPSIPGEKTRKVTFPSVPITGYDPGENLTVIGVADWCKDRHINLTDDPCGANETSDEAGVPAEQNVLFDQYVVPPSIEVTTELQSPLSRDDLKASEDQSNQLRVNVTNLHTTGLAEDLRLRYHMTDRVNDADCPDGAKEDGQGDEKCETTLDGPSGGATVSELIHWDSTVGGERLLTVIIEYPAIDSDDPDAPDNAPARAGFATDTFYYPAVDWVPGQDVEAAAATPGDEAFRVDSTLANVGDLAADETGVDQKVQIDWTRCNRLLQPSSGYRCDRKEQGPWALLNGAGDSTHKFDLVNFPPGGIVNETIFWDTDLQAPGVWRIRTRADNLTLWEDLEHSRANNADVDTVRMTNASWLESGPIEQEFVGVDEKEELDFDLNLTNDASEPREFEVFRVNGSCNPDCTPEEDNWRFHLLNESGDRLNDNQSWYPGEGRTPVTVEEVPAGGTAELTFQVVPQQDLEPDHFVNATLVVCEKDGFNATDACHGDDGPLNGDVIDLRAFFDPPWDPVIRMQSADKVNVDAGGTASFFFKVENGADVEADAFQLRGIIDPAGDASEPQWTRLDPISECPNDDHTVNPDNPDASGQCSNLDLIEMDPGQSNRFRMRTTVDETVADGSIVNVTLEATSQRSTEDEGPTIQKTRLLQIGVGTDIAPPTIEATPPSGSAVQPGTPIVFNVTDDSQVASVERQIDNGSFRPFEGDDHVVETDGRPDGDLKIRVRARDDGAREQTRTFDYVVDGTPPAFQAVQVDPSVAFAGGTIEVAVGLSEANPDSVVANTGGSQADLTFDSATGLWTAEQIPAPDETGIHSVDVTATDRAGNQEVANASYEVVRPDISLDTEDITAEPRSPTEGETLTVTARFANPTGAEVTGYPVSLSIDGETVVETQVTLVANAKTAVTLEWESEAGGHDISVCGDPQETIPDPDRDNQCGQLSVHVRDMGLIPGPEIVIIAAALVLGALGRRRWDARDAHQGYPRD